MILTTTRLTVQEFRTEAPALVERSHKPTYRDGLALRKTSMEPERGPFVDDWPLQRAYLQELQSSLSGLPSGLSLIDLLSESMWEFA